VHETPVNRIISPLRAFASLREIFVRLEDRLFFSDSASLRARLAGNICAGRREIGAACGVDLRNKKARQVF
jgi:hypothetical protein